jgi:outer membrane receptor protein involved in Fe transport
MTKNTLRVALLATVCQFGLMGTALAQEVPDADGPDGEEATQGEAIVVTGSRIARRDYTAESPILTVDEEFLENSGPVTIEQSLNALPQFQPSQGAQTSSIGAAGAGSSGGRSTANLRGLGPERTLILFDGRRLQPSDPSNTVDLNTISPALISTVEVITGGASAVYGSDAVAGVVNFRFNDRFRGFQLNADAGISDEGDAENYSIAGTWGGSFADDSARLFLSASYYDRGTASADARRTGEGDAGTSTPTSGLLVQSRTNPFGLPAASLNYLAYRNLFLNTYGTEIPSIASSYLVNSDGTILSSVDGINLRDTETTGYNLTDTGQVRQRSFNDSTVQIPLERYTGFARGEFDLGTSVTAYAQLIYANYSTDQLSSTGVTQSVVDPIQISASNPFITPDLRILLNSRPNPNGPITYYFNTGRLGRLRAQQNYDVFQGLVGLEGDISDNLRFDVYASYGRTDQEAISGNQVSRTRFNEVVNAPDGGASLCDGGFDPFGFAPASQECRDYLTFSSTDMYEYEQTIVQGNLTGDLFDLPGGKAAFALGAEYRDNGYVVTIDPRNSPTPTGTPGVTTSPEALGTSGSESTQGDLNVKEVYAEVLLPLLGDMPGAERLEVDLAYRYSDYNLFGGVSTYKAGANWEPVRGLSLRGGYSRAIRAPSLGDLFSPRSATAGIIGFASEGAGDPCDVLGPARNGEFSSVDPDQVRSLCLQQGISPFFVDSFSYRGGAISALRFGNPDLTEETADSYTIGAVIQPRFLDSAFRSFAFSIDYYDITVENAIGYITSPIALKQCFNLTGQNPDYDPDNVFCQQINRDSNGFLSNVEERLANLATYKTAGLDMQLDASIGLGGDAYFAFNSAVNHTFDYQIQSIETEPLLDYAGTIGNAQIDGFSSTHPAWKAATTGTLGIGPASLALRWRYTGAMDSSNNVGVAGSADEGVPAISYFDLIGRYAFNEDLELRAGITNLTEPDAPIFGGGIATSAYDIIGRRFFLGIKAGF